MKIVSDQAWGRANGYVKNAGDFAHYQSAVNSYEQKMAAYAVNDANRIAEINRRRQEDFRTGLMEQERHAAREMAPALVPFLLGRLAGPALPSLNDKNGWDFTSSLLNDDVLFSVQGSVAGGLGGTAEIPLLSLESNRFDVLSGEAKGSIDNVAYGGAVGIRTNLGTARYNFERGTVVPIATSIQVDLGPLGFQASLDSRGAQLQLSGGFAFGAHFSLHSLTYVHEINGVRGK